MALGLEKFFLYGNEFVWIKDEDRTRLLLVPIGIKVGSWQW